jgi:hypothetical protein
VLNGEHLPPYSGSRSVWHRYFWKPPETDQALWHATAFKGWAQAAPPWVRAHLWPPLASPPGHRLCQVGWWLGLGSSCGGAWPRLSHEGGLLHFFVCTFLEYAFCFALFTWFCVFSTCSRRCVLQNVFSRIQVETC